jgi:hypothetical protein
MPIHNWKVVRAGEFHDFHQGWSIEIRTALNRGILPPDYYALIEQPSGEVEPDVLTLHRDEKERGDASDPVGALALETAPPKVKISAVLEEQWYLYRKNRIGIHHSSDDRMVAMIELVSPGNKSSRHRFDRFVDKAVGAIEHGIHLLVVDLFPPTRRDPEGIHGAIWSELGNDSFKAVPNKPLTLASYVANMPPRAFIEPVAVGDILIPMPLFLTSDRYVTVPLEETYVAGLEGVPHHIRAELESTLSQNSA